MGTTYGMLVYLTTIHQLAHKNLSSEEQTNKRTIFQVQSHLLVVLDGEIEFPP